MFSSLKPTFGAPANNTSFGFPSNATPNPFGQSTFGKSPAGFGTPSSAFGSSAAPLFGSTSQHGSLFATTTPTASFGQPATTQPTFGSGMFGSTSVQPSGNGLFGAANTSTFGQSNKSTGFGFGSNTGNTGFFGQQASQVQPQQQSTGLFGQNSSNLFGASPGFGSNTASNQMGTVLKFTPVTGTDTMVKGSINQTISTRHHCITCMKEYESKSLEELRWEDYQANRKGPQQGAQPAGGLFGNMNQSVSGGLFGSGPVATSSNTLFGQQENKSVFGSNTATGGFGQTNTGFGGTPSTNTTSGLFGKPISGFGTNATTSTAFPFSSSAPTNNLFGANTVAKPFGATSQQNTLFGQPSSGFGTQSFGSFGTATNQNVGLFNQNKTTPFNIGTSTNNSFGTFGQAPAQNTGTLFPGAKPSTGFGSFGVTTSAPLFGQSSFGQSNQTLFNASFNKPAAPLFGQTNTTNTLGTSLSMPGGSNLFGNNTNKPNTMFGNSIGMFNSGFGNNSNTTSFNLGGTAVQTGVPNSDQSQNSGEQQIISMSSVPYGLPNLLNNVSEVDHDLKDSTRPTNPAELNALLNTVNKSQTNAPTEKLQPVQVFGRKIPMFEGLEQRDETLISNIRINNNPKRLIIRKKRGSSRSLGRQDQVQELRGNQDDDHHQELDTFRSNHSNIPESELSESLTTDIVPESNRSTQTLSNLGNPFDDSRNSSVVDLSGVELPHSTMLQSPQKVLVTSKSTITAEEDVVDEEPDLFTEASESQDWQEDNNDITLGLVNVPQKLNKSSPNTKSSNTASDVVSVLHPTGIILTRPEYYTVPSLDDLVKYVSEDGSCVVKGFTIGRFGYGNVSFQDAFDVSNLNLDELVHFRHKEINIYPDESKKPPQGQGLNRRAQVTLDKVWPLDKKLKALVTDVESLTKMDYAGRLRRLCEKQNTRYVEYRPDTGSWVFKVDHFSKYGHRDSDESDEEITPSKEQEKKTTDPKTGIEQGSAKLPKAVALENESVTHGRVGLKDITISSLMHTVHSGESEHYTDIDSYEAFRSPQLNFRDDIGKCTLMKSTFFENETADYDDSFSDAGSNVGGILELSNYVTNSSPKYVEICIGEDNLVMNIMEGENKHSYISLDEPEYVPVSCMTGCIPMHDSYINNYNVADIAAFKGRSFKVGWGKDATFLCLSTRNTVTEQDVLRSSNDYSPTSIRCINVKKIQNKYDDEHCDLIESHLQCELSHSTVEIVDDVPYFTPKQGSNLLEAHQGLMKNSPKTSYHKHVWDLCMTLWGQISMEEMHKYDVRLIRNNLFSEWIKGVVEITVKNEVNFLKRDIVSNILTCISGNKIDEASTIALNYKHYNLSVLLSQLPSSLCLRTYMEKQLEQWNQCNVHNHVEHVLLKLYMLIAGKPYANFKDKLICTYEDMDWKRVLAIYFWYIIEPARPLSEAVNMYENTFTNYVHTPKPVPFYHGAEEGTYDLLFQLLKFYSDNCYPLSHVLNPVTHTDDLLDYRLSWLLLQTLTSLGHADLSKQAKVHIHISFAAQLEQMGLWHWAVFVLLYIEDASIKRTHIIDIIGRHVKLHLESTPEYCQKEKMLVEKLHIPSTWIDSAKATLALLQGNYKEAFYYLCYAEKWPEAHDVIMKHFVPDHFLNYDYDFLIKTLTPLSNHTDIISNWEEAGGLVLDFAKLGIYYNDIITMNDQNIKKNLTNFRSAVINVSIRFKRFLPYTYMHDVCLAEMTGRISVMLRKLLHVIDGNTEELCIEAAMTAQLLPMTGDYLKQELNAILVDFLNQGHYNS